MAVTIIHEHPALFLGQLRDDLERVHAEDEQGNHVPFRFKDGNTNEGDLEPEWQIVGEVLLDYPNTAEFEIIEE